MVMANPAGTVVDSLDRVQLLWLYYGINIVVVAAIALTLKVRDFTLTLKGEFASLPARFPIPMQRLRPIHLWLKERVTSLTLKVRE
jgi:hypothetical protein